MEKSRREVCYARAGDFWEKSHQAQLALRSEPEKWQQEIFLRTFLVHCYREPINGRQLPIHAARDQSADLQDWIYKM